MDKEKKQQNKSKIHSKAIFSFTWNPYLVPKASSQRKFSKLSFIDKSKLWYALLVPSSSQSKGKSFIIWSDSAINSFRAFNHELLPSVIVKDGDLHQRHTKIITVQTINKQTRKRYKD